jgi:hypothetical protein
LHIRHFTPLSFAYTLEQTGGTVIERQVKSSAESPAGIDLNNGWTRNEADGNRAIYRTQFIWPRQQPPNALLVIEGMTQVLLAKLNGTPLGTRLAHPFRFDLSPALRTGSNALELEHVERHTFRSKLGTVRVLPYRLITVDTHGSNQR